MINKLTSSQIDKFTKILHFSIILGSFGDRGKNLHLPQTMQKAIAQIEPYLRINN